jgi:hypothetical protein
MFAAGGAAIAVYLYEAFALPVDRLQADMFVNPRFGGLAAATVIASVAVSLRVQRTWPAAGALIAIAPLWFALLREGSYGAWIRETTDVVFIIGVALLPLTAIVTLLLPRPPAVVPEARLRP